MTKKKVDPMALFQGTIVAEIAEVAAAGKFEDFSEELLPGEDVLGELNDFEKAAYTLSSRNVDEHNKFVDLARKAGAPKKQVLPVLVQLDHTNETAMAMLWHSVKNRLRLYGESHLALRKGHKVVRMNRAAVHMAEMVAMGAVMRDLLGGVPD